MSVLLEADECRRDRSRDAVFGPVVDGRQRRPVRTGRACLAHAVGNAVVQAYQRELDAGASSPGHAARGRTSWPTRPPPRSYPSARARSGHDPHRRHRRRLKRHPLDAARGCERGWPASAERGWREKAEIWRLIARPTHFCPLPDTVSSRCRPRSRRWADQANQAETFTTERETR